MGLMLLTSVPLFSQLTWNTSLPSNPQFSSPTGNAQVEMYNKKVYQIYDSATNYLKVSVYDPKFSTWKRKITHFVPNYFASFKTFKKDSSIFIVASGGVGFDVYKYDIWNNQVTQVNVSTISTFTMPSNFELVVKGNYVYFVYEDNASVFLAQVDYTTGGVSTLGVDSEINPGFTGGKFTIYASNTKLYVANNNSNTRMGTCPLGTISSFATYDGGTGEIKKNGSLLSTCVVDFAGDGNIEPYAIVHDPNSNTSFTKQMTSATLDIQTATDMQNVLNMSDSDFTTISAANYSYNISQFSLNGTSSPHDLFYINRFDLNNLTWDTLGPKIEFGTYTSTPYKLHASLDNGNSHMAVSYRDANNGFTFKVLNNLPSPVSGSITPNTGLCYGHRNLIFPEIQLVDTDNDLLNISYFYSSTGMFQNVQVVPVGIDYSVSPAVQKFAVYADVPNSGSDVIVIYFSDGYNTYVLNLPSVSVTNAAPNLNFSTTPTILCSNENMVSLQDKVNYYDGGTFFINGNAIAGTNVNAQNLALTSTTGTLAYKTNIGGCILETSGIYAMATVATANANTTATTCGLNSGTATVNYVQGTYPVTAVEWSTGETSATINNLSPGAYYYAITDAQNCHVTGFASVGISGASLSPTVTNVSCYGAHDGSISLNISGMTTPLIIWSNGYSNTASQTNLGPGSYWVTVSDVSGCQITESFIITEPDPIQATFSTFEPDCGLANGKIYGTYNGGSGNYNFNWLGTGQTGQDLLNVTYGNYTVIVTDNVGCSKTFTYQMDDYQATDIKDSVILAHCGKNDGAILLNFSLDPNGGSFPSSLTWSNGNETWNNYNLSAGTYTVTAYSGPSTFTNQMCVSQKTITIGTKQPLAQDICIVTVDTATTTNLVVWEKLELEGISHYNIYRENTTAGLFVQIDTVDFDNLSVFNDVIASPMDRSWRYRISAVNTCGIEGPISPIHKTLHLNAIVNLGNGSYDVLWDDYEGTQNVNAYVVWRHTDQLGWQAVSPAIPVGTSIYNDMPPVNSTGIDYYVEMSLIVPCSATKAQDFNTTRSNRERGQFAPGNGTGNSSNELGELTNLEVNLYPNPTTDNITLVTNTEINLPIRVLSVEGKVLLETTSEGITTLLNLDNLNQGLYLVEIKLGNKRIINQIVKR